MKREEAIKDLDIIRFNPHWDELVNEEYWKELMQMAITALQNQPVWIPVSERLPEKNGKYLVFLTNPVRNQSDNVFTSWYNVYYKEFETEKSLDYVKAWMPLPEPYRESEVDNGEV